MFIWVTRISRVIRVKKSIRRDLTFYVPGFKPISNY